MESAIGVAVKIFGKKINPNSGFFHLFVAIAKFIPQNYGVDNFILQVYYKY